MKYSLLVLLYFQTTLLFAKCLQVDYDSGPNKVAVIELYTSEGCSSCPPAEAWLNSLQSHPGLWKEFIPLAFHVDYWNYLGHHDTLASREFSQRQRAYAQEWKQNNVYTPEFILNGHEWRSSFARQLPSAKMPEQSLKVKHQGGGKFLIRSHLDQGLAHAVLIHNNIRHEIKAGENKGKILKHWFVVKEHKVANLRAGDAMIDLDVTGTDSGDWAVAFWTSEKNSLTPIQATAGCLKN